MRRILHIAIALALLLPAAVTAQAWNFEAHLKSQIEASGVPGAVVAVFKDGKIIYHEAFGLADIGDDTPMHKDMAFEIGSVSKQFVAVALLTFVEDGDLDLDDTLGKALPSAPREWHSVTIEQLLRHLSGVPDYEAIAGYDFYNEPREPQDIFDQALTKDVDFPAGYRFSYSNTGYVLLSLIVERAAGKPISDVLDERLFKPAGMTSTYAAARPDGVHPATGYHSRTGERREQPPIAWSSTLAAGGIVSTIKDMQRWDEALYGDVVLKQGLLKRIWSLSTLNDGSDFSYGFGLFMGTFRALPFQDHSGQTNGFTCYFMRFPDHRYSVVMWTNTYGGSVAISAARQAAIHFLPELNYNSIEIREDQEPERTALHVQALWQAIVADGETDLLSPGMKDFAELERFKPQRTPYVPALESTKSFEFVRLRERTSDSGSELHEYLYKHTFEDGVFFWTMTIINGKLSRLIAARE